MENEVNGHKEKPPENLENKGRDLNEALDASTEGSQEVINSEHSNGETIKHRDESDPEAIDAAENQEEINRERTPSEDELKSSEERPTSEMNEEDIAERRPKDQDVLEQIAKGKLSSRKGSKEGHDTSTTETLPSVQVTQAQRGKIKFVFVPSEDYEVFKKSGFGTYEQRVHIICGPENAGKFTTAVHLGMELNQDQLSDTNFCVYYNASSDSSSSLIEAIQVLRYPTILVVENAFEAGFGFTDIETHLSLINDMLQNSESYLILTTVDKPQLKKINVNQIQAEVKDMESVFNNHLDFYARGFAPVYVQEEIIQRARSLNEKKRLLNLSQPFQVDRFCHELSALPSDASEEYLINLAETIGQLSQEHTREWFAGLDKNEKLYSMLVLLLSGLNRHTVDDIYIKSVNWLRNDKVPGLKDPRVYGFDDLLESIRVNETKTGSLRFNTQSIREEVRRQLKNYHYLLWSLGTMLFQLAEQNRGPQHWEFRRAIGASIGQLGVYYLPENLHRLRHHLDEIARHKSAGVAVVAGYALEGICRLQDKNNHEFVTQTIKEWIESGDPDLMWTAGASIWRVYDEIKTVSLSETDEASEPKTALDELRESMTMFARKFSEFNGHAIQTALERAIELAKSSDKPTQDLFVEQLFNWSQGNIDSLLHAIRQIAKVYAGDIVDLIANWLSSDELNLVSIGLMATQQLFRENTHPDLELIEERQAPLLDLILPTLNAEDQRTNAELKTHTVNMIVRSIQIWLGDKNWKNRIHSKLLWAVNRIPHSGSIAMRRSLLQQLLEDKTSHPWIFDIRQSIIARTSMLNGYLSDLPSPYSGVCIIDDSYEAKLANRIFHLGFRLFETFSPHTDMKIYQLGRAELLGETGNDLQKLRFRSGNDQPRLLFPILSSLDEKRSHFALVLTSGPLIDVKDLSETTWYDKLLVVSFDEDYTEDDIDIIAIDPALHNQEDKFGEVEELVQSHIANNLLSRSVSAWNGWLEAFVGFEVSDIHFIPEKLEKWIDQLDDIDCLASAEDPARRIATTVLWLSANDLSFCLSIIREWLTQDDLLRRVTGIACGKMIFRLYSYGKDIPSVQSHAKLLNVIPDLCTSGWDAIHVVLRSLRKWSSEPNWLKHLLVDSTTLSDLVEASLPNHKARLLEELGSWTAPYESAPDKEIPTYLIKIIRRLKLLVAMKSRSSLPTLPEGHKYSLVIVDTAEHDPLKRRRLKYLAEKTIQSIIDLDNEEIHLLVHRLGNNVPVLMDTGAEFEENDAEAITLSPIEDNRSRLLGPLLDLYQIEEIGLLLILTNGPILDVKDWKHTDWHEKVTIYSESSDIGWAHGLDLIKRQHEIDSAEIELVKFTRRSLGL